MLNPQTEAKQITQETVDITQCPLCQSFTLHMYYMQDAKTQKRSKWYSCSCGLIWQPKPPSFVYDKSYLTPEGPKFTNASKYLVKVVSPLIEESIYGRRCLVVGQNQGIIDELRARGWVTYCIDLNVDIPTSERHIQGDLETWEFPSDFKFNMIFMYQVLECFKNPFETLKKIFNLLAEDGILFIGTPCTDFLYTRSPSGFKHWNQDHNHIMWSQKSLVSFLENLGFNVIMARKNYEHRFPAQDDLWLTAQKRYF